ncbi:hypothetical protein [Polynucleobacter necessarius]|nr:hypothetical protein [Polynucleobacter necessarius]
MNRLEHRLEARNSGQGARYTRSRRTGHPFGYSRAPGSI